MQSMDKELERALGRGNEWRLFPRRDARSDVFESSVDDGLQCESPARAKGTACWAGREPSQGLKEPKQLV